MGVLSVPQVDPFLPRVVVRRAALVPAAVLLAAGIALGRYVALPPGVPAALAALGLALAAAGLVRPRLLPAGQAGVAVAILALGVISGDQAWRRLAPDHIVTFSAFGGVRTSLRGAVAEPPEIRAARTQFWQEPRTHFLLEVEAVRRVDGAWQRAVGPASVTVGEPLSGLGPGQRVELIGTLARLRGPDNPGQYDWRQSARMAGLHVRFAVPGRDGVTVLPGEPSLAEAALWRLRAMAREQVAAGREPSALVEALVIGERNESLRRLNRAMVESGTAHLLSISGTHLAIFLGFVYGLCRLLAMAPRRAALAALTVLGLYLLVAEPQTPLLRSAIMAAAVCIAAIRGRDVSTGNALAAAALILLAVWPMQLFNVGFQLSFGIVTGIVVLQGPLRRLLFRRWLARRGLIIYRGRQRLWRALLARARDWGMTLAAVSLAAAIASAPLVAYHFGIFSPYASVLTLVLLVPITLVLVPAYLSMALAAVTPNLAGALAEAAAVAAGWTTRLAMSFRHLPGVSLEVRPFSPWLAAAFYAAVGLWLAAARRRRLVWLAGPATAALLVAFALSQRAAPLPGGEPPGSELHVVAVGHGSMALLRGPDGRTALLDAGTLSPGDAYNEILRPLLRARRLSPPQDVVISHPNLDHYGALAEMLVHRPPRRVFVSERFDAEPADRGGASLLRRLERAGVKLVRLRQGDRLELCGADVEVLWPPPLPELPELDANDGSLVLRITCGGRRVLLPGDAGELPQSRLARLEPQRLACDVLMLPHHGSYSRTLAGFCRAVGPKVFLQSSGYRPDDPKVLTALAGRPIYRTCRDGWIRVSLGRELAVETMANPAREDEDDSGP